MIPYDYYRIFYHVARYNSFSRAAEVLGNNQPNLSRCINILENSLGCKLFRRSNRGAQLTEDGEKLFAHVKIAYEHILQGEEEIRKIHDPETGIINIGASDIAMNVFLVDMLEAYRNVHPKIRLRIKTSTSAQALSALSSGMVDFAVVTTPTEIDKKYLMVPLGTFKEILMIGPKYMDRTKPSYNFEAISNWPIISNNSETSTHRFYLDLFLKHGFQFTPAIEVETAEQILFMVSHNLGCGFYPEKLAASALENGDVLKAPIDFEIPERQICLVADRSRLYNSAAREFINDYILNGNPYYAEQPSDEK